MEQKATSFPSHFVSKKTKEGKGWCLQYLKGFHSESNQPLTSGDYAIMKSAAGSYQRWRSYARGEQDPNQYKEMMGLKKEKGKFSESFRNLNFDILKVAPKIKHTLVNKIINQRYNINVKPIDQTSIKEQHQYKARMVEYVTNQQEIQRFEMLTKLGLEKPIGPGEIPPASHVEIDPWMELHPKNMIAMEVKDFIDWSLYYNDWDQLKEELISGLVDDGVAGTRVYLDPNGFIRVRRLLIDRCIANKCIFPDFRDLIRFAEYYEITVSELRRITNGRLVGDNGETGENVYRKIANSLPDTNNRYVNDSTTYWNPGTFSYAYDHEKITIMEGLWYSDDEDTYVQYENESGNKRVKEQDYGYVPGKGDPKFNNGKGMSDEEYKTRNNGRKEIMRKRVRNVYTGCWIVNTDMCYNFGLLPNILRSVSMTGEAQMPVAIATTDFQSTMGTIEQGLDQIQLQWLHFQSHSSASKPPGIAIEKKALSQIAVGGKGGDKKWDPKEDLMLWAEFGSFIYDGYDRHGNALNHLPFQELKGGLSPGALEHFALIVQMIELIRNQLGINQMTEGQLPAERTGKTVAQLTFGASDNALSHLNKAYRRIFEKTCRNMVMTMQGAIDHVNLEGMSEGLGVESTRFFSLNSDIGMRELGITMEEGPDDAMKEKISNILNNAVAANEIDAEDALLIEMTDNYYKAVIMIRKRKREKEARMASQQEGLIRAQGEEATRTSVATQQAKGQSDMALLDKERELEQMKSNHRRQEQAEKFLQDVALKKLEQSNDMAEEDRDFLLEVMKLNQQYKIAEMTTQAKKQQKAA